jgi:hypothetical protein
VYLFDVWARDRINRIALHMQAKFYTPAQKCLLQGQEPEGLLFLFHGFVKVFRSPVTYMSKAEAALRQRMSVGGIKCCMPWKVHVAAQHKLIHSFVGPFLTAVPDGECSPADGVSLPALQKLRTQVCLLHHCSLIEPIP